MLISIYVRFTSAAFSHFRHAVHRARLMYHEHTETYILPRVCWNNIWADQNNSNREYGRMEAIKSPHRCRNFVDIAILILMPSVWTEHCCSLALHTILKREHRSMVSMRQAKWIGTFTWYIIFYGIYWQ